MKLIEAALPKLCIQCATYHLVSLARWHSMKTGSLIFAHHSCRDWGMVKHVKDQIQSQRHRPRMGKAISIMLELNERTVQEWFS